MEVESRPGEVVISPYSWSSGSVSKLPIFDVLPQLKTALANDHEIVLQAPPGAGKTTVVPLALLQEEWLRGQKILLLEPRRMAARSAATYMAQLLGEKPGETVGYRIRLESKVSSATRIEVITEGILARMLQDDPSLKGVGLVIFDEFHERNLDSDLGLALLLQGRELFRDKTPLKLVVMSATLDGEALASLLGNAPVLSSLGRQHPVDVVYAGQHKLRESILKPSLDAILHCLQDGLSGILVFLPGQGEIQALRQALPEALSEVGIEHVELAVLYGGLSMEDQQKAMQVAAEGFSKVVLATNVAETSLTIAGVDCVVDSGLVREPVFQAATGITRLVTRRVSLASAEQRRGRAGRLGPGVCYRLWSESQQHQLVAQPIAQIKQSDLTPLALQLLAWGVQNPAELQWLDNPPPGPYQQGLELLRVFGATAAEGPLRLTPHGQVLASLPVQPRLAHMLVAAAQLGQLECASLLAALVSERNPVTHDGAGIEEALAILQGQLSCPGQYNSWCKRIRRQAKQYVRILSRQDIATVSGSGINFSPEELPGILLAFAFPDRIARKRSAGDEVLYKLSNGRGVRLNSGDPLENSEWLVVSDAGGRSGDSYDRVYSAASLAPIHFDTVLCELVREEKEVYWDQKATRVVARLSRKVGDVVIDSSTLEDLEDEQRADVLLEVIARDGLQLLNWTEEVTQWCGRVNLLHRLERGNADNPWPDLDQQALLKNLNFWLAPYLDGVNSAKGLKALDLLPILQALLAWPSPLELERLTPKRLTVPSGSSIAIDYRQNPPVLAVKLQEMFGSIDTPRIADGRVALQLQLLSPAGRALQLTQDLAGFWKGSYNEVKKEMKGRYPKHPWPDDPLSATATRHTRRALLRQQNLK